MKIGIISDTHNFFDPQIPRLLAGVEHILHSGDIGLPRILFQLEEIAPVTAVSGNTDDPGFHYPLTEVLQLAQTKFLLHHIVNPHSIQEVLQHRIDLEKPDVVVFGHSHKPFCERRDGVLFFNPGYAGRSRFALPRSVALLHCGPQGVRPEYLPLRD